MLYWGKERQGSLHLWWSLMQAGECEVSPHVLQGSPLYSIYLVMSWVCDGETQRHILTVHQSQGPCGPVQTTPLPDYLARVVLSLSCLLQGTQAYIQFLPSSCAETFHLHWALVWAPICKWCRPCCGLGRLSE